MGCKQQYQVFKGDSISVVHYAKRKIALEWVARGLAVLVGDKQIKMVNQHRDVARTTDYLASTGQDKAYELAAIDSNPSFVQGGLVGGIRRQLKNDPFSGAKVGHQ